MLSSITPLATTNHPQAAVAPAVQSKTQVKTAVVSQQSAQAQPQTAITALTDTVSISTAAQAALKEAIETPSQTAREAGSGDRQAQRLLAREIAANHIA